MPFEQTLIHNYRQAGPPWKSLVLDIFQLYLTLRFVRQRRLTLDII